MQLQIVLNNEVIVFCIYRNVQRPVFPEPAGAWNAPLHGSSRDLPSGVVSVTTAAAPARYV